MRLNYKLTIPFILSLRPPSQSLQPLKTVLKWPKTSAESTVCLAMTASVMRTLKLTSQYF